MDERCEFGCDLLPYNIETLDVLLGLLFRRTLYPILYHSTTYILVDDVFMARQQKNKIGYLQDDSNTFATFIPNMVSFFSADDNIFVYER